MATVWPARLSDRFPADRISFERSGADEVVVRLRGTCGYSTGALLSDLLVELMVVDEAKVIVDMSEITSMDSATVVLFQRAASFLARRSRRLVLRSPSSFVRRALERWGAGQLVEACADQTGRGAGPIGDGTTATAAPGLPAAQFPIGA